MLIGIIIVICLLAIFALGFAIAAGEITIANEENEYFTLQQYFGMRYDIRKLSAVITALGIDDKIIIDGRAHYRLSGEQIKEILRLYHEPPLK